MEKTRPEWCRLIITDEEGVGSLSESSLCITEEEEGRFRQTETKDPIERKKNHVGKNLKRAGLHRTSWFLSEVPSFPYLKVLDIGDGQLSYSLADKWVR